VATGFVAEAGLGDRIDFIPAKQGFGALPAGADIVLMSYLCSAMGRAGTTALIGQAFDALGSGGRVLIHDFMVEDDSHGPDLAACWSLAMVMGNPDAQVIRPGPMRAALEQAGFADIRIRPLIADITSLIEATRP
jgi:hypothetical protein